MNTTLHKSVLVIGGRGKVGRRVGHLYELTGPRMLTFRETIAEIANAADRDIRYIPVSVEDYAAELKKQDNIPAETGVWRT